MTTGQTTGSGLPLESDFYPMGAGGGLHGAVRARPAAPARPVDIAPAAS